MSTKIALKNATFFANPKGFDFFAFVPFWYGVGVAVPFLVLLCAVAVVGVFGLFLCLILSGFPCGFRRVVVACHLAVFGVAVVRACLGGAVPVLYGVPLTVSVCVLCGGSFWLCSCVL